MSPDAPHFRPKSEVWAGYFAPYYRKAEEDGIRVIDIVDDEWTSGRHAAEVCVHPYVTPDSKVLEIACGVGRVSVHVAPACLHLTCTDIIDEALRGCKEALAAQHNVSYLRIEGYGLPEFSDASFDCVYSFTTFFHFDFELVVTYFAEIKRVLKPGGIGVIEFKQFKSRRDIDTLLTKIHKSGGLRAYESDLSKWRYVGEDGLKILADYFGLEVLVWDQTHFTFRTATVG